MTVRKKAFGKTGVQVTELGMGTYYDWRWIRFAKRGWMWWASRKVKALKAGLDGGLNLIDSAEVYRSEPLVAKAIRGRKRDELFISTKVWHDNLHRDDLIMSLEKSLKRLETSYVDLYQPHFPSHRVPIQETMAAMEEMQQKGKLRYIGLSNFDLQQLIEAQQALRRSEIVSAQVRYSLMHREIENEPPPLLPEEQHRSDGLLPSRPRRARGRQREDGRGLQDEPRRLPPRSRSTGSSRSRGSSRFRGPPPRSTSRRT